MTDVLDYDLMVDNALRGVMVSAIELVTREGLPGEHHFYITFRTDHPRARVGNDLKAKYPEEITVVMQHQFWDLTIDDKGFTLGLSFNQVPQDALHSLCRRDLLCRSQRQVRPSVPAPGRQRCRRR